jgi:hypothetical protein
MLWARIIGHACSKKRQVIEPVFDLTLPMIESEVT